MLTCNCAWLTLKRAANGYIVEGPSKIVVFAGPNALSEALALIERYFTVGKKGQ